MNNFITTNCILKEFTAELLKRSSNFSCGDKDLDEFFHNDAETYRTNLMGKTYCFVLKDNEAEIVAAFTVANDSLRIDDLPNNRRKKMIKRTSKHLKRYPGVLIGRLGVNTKYQGKGYGSEILEFIKYWFSEPENKTGCRFVIVDAINCKKVLDFYTNKVNKFEFLFSSDIQELSYENQHLTLLDKIKLFFCSKQKEGKPTTRLMYFDLLDLFNSDKVL